MSDNNGSVNEPRGDQGQQPGFGQPQPQQPQQSYQQPPSYSQPAPGAMPSYPAPGMANPVNAQPPAGPVVRPSTVNTAVWLMYLGALVEVVITIIGITQVGNAVSSLDLQNSNVDPSKARSAVTGIGIATLIIQGVISVGLWIWMALAHQAGQGWARILATVFAAINIVFGIVGLFRGGNAFALILSIIYLLVSIAALIVMWMRPNTEYIKAKGAQRVAKRQVV